MFRRSRFFWGKPTPGTEIKDITWLKPDGTERSDGDWHLPGDRCLSFVLSGEAVCAPLFAGPVHEALLDQQEQQVQSLAQRAGGKYRPGHVRTPHLFASAFFVPLLLFSEQIRLQERVM